MLLQREGINQSIDTYAMIINEVEIYQERVVIVMSDISIIAASAKTTLLEIAKQASALATGLQNVAPGDKKGTPNKSVQYLFNISESLTKIAEECGKFLTSSSPSEQDKQSEQ
jgi:2-phospho-L-lactate guanylyltransferase (CobY/MobA/RfbA family)